MVKAAQYLLASIFRHVWSIRIAAMAVVGGALVTLGWWNGEDAWKGLLTSLVGLGAGVGLVWAPFHEVSSIARCTSASASSSRVCRSA